MEEWGPTSGDGGLVFDGSARCRNPPPNTLDTSPFSEEKAYHNLRATTGHGRRRVVPRRISRERKRTSGPTPRQEAGTSLTCLVARPGHQIRRTSSPWMCVDQSNAKRAMISWSLFLLGVFVATTSHFVFSYAPTYRVYDVG
ncbi:hypothetical protein B296_00056994 [Ensete ventricosum]|uniref:Uncharacterized protein n=1 Tax=Ensete ventricosum TaxID=4639 RepID=A0A426WYE4_ENSVE|nr:hypothetical protein B296_00056994 [Ensete ventricosum]